LAVCVHVGCSTPQVAGLHSHAAHCPTLARSQVGHFMPGNSLLAGLVPCSGVLPEDIISSRPPSLIIHYQRVANGPDKSACALVQSLIVVLHFPRAPSHVQITGDAGTWGAREAQVRWVACSLCRRLSRGRFSVTLRTASDWQSVTFPRANCKLWSARGSKFPQESCQSSGLSRTGQPVLNNEVIYSR